MVTVHDPVSKPTTQCTYRHIQCTLQHTATLCSLQPTIQCISSAHTAAAITSSVHTAAMYSHVQLSAANLQCTLQPTAAIYNHLHCSYSIQCTLQLYYPVHIAVLLSSAHCSHVQLSAANLQYTLQLYHPVHTAATLSGSNTIQYIQCTFGPPQGKPIPLLAYLQNSQQTLMVDCSSP